MPVGVDVVLVVVPVGPPPVGGTRCGCRMLYFCWLMVYQSSSAIPPVSPEFGFHDQYVNDIPFAVRYCIKVLSHCTSSGLARVLPNSPSMIGATFCLAMLPQKWSHTPGRLFGNAGSLNHTWRSKTEIP